MSTPIINSSNKKFAVLIGINYIGTSSQLSGCINDAIHLKSFLISKAGYLPENVLLIVDDGTTPLKPTKQNIINTFDTLIQKANSGFTELWFSYSGHGTYLADTNGDEADKRDEAICPVDYSTAGMIVDDFIYDNLVAKLPSTATLFSLMDSCYSGTVYDLPFIYIQSFATNNNKNNHVATVVSISGCRDDQTSADAYINNNYEGAMTWSFLNALAKANYNTKLVDLVNSMRVLLKGGSYTQVPLLAVSSNTQYDRSLIQLSSSIPLPTPGPRSVKFSIKTDYWYTESSWNVWSNDKGTNIFPTDKKFTTRYQLTELTQDLALGKYKLVLKDSYGDGGISAKVSIGAITLLSATMASGKLAEYAFEVV